MSFRTGLLAIADAVRGIAGPNGVDIRTNQLVVVKRTWSGNRIRQGNATDETLELPKKYPVRPVSQDEISSSGGLYESGDVLVDHITPSDGASVGFTVAQLKPPISGDNQERIYKLVGEHAGEYALVELRTFRPFTFQMVLRRRSTTP